MNKISIIYILALVNVILGTSMAVTVSGVTSAGMNTASFQIDATLGHEAIYSANVALDESALTLNQKVNGKNEFNKISNGISDGVNSIQTQLSSDDSLSSSLNCIASTGYVAANQNGQISGSEGSAETVVDALSNSLLVYGIYNGEGNLNLDQHSVASNIAFASGETEFKGISLDSSQIDNSKDSGLMVKGLFQSEKDIGEFGIGAFNFQKDGAQFSSQSGKGAAKISDEKEYGITGCLDTRTPIQLFVANNGLPSNLLLSDARSEIQLAANTWDGLTSKTLFSNTLGEASPYTSEDVSANLNDNKWMHQWTTSGTILGDTENAIAVTWYRTSGLIKDASKVPRPKIVAADCYYNGLMQWSTDGNSGYDLRTISLHELGHFVGLDDLYYNSANDEVMYGYYKGVDRDPYIGDIAGIKKLYGV
jgi:hypothetical protein